MPYPSSLLDQACERMEAFAEAFKAALSDPISPGVIDPAESRALLGEFAPAYLMVARAESAQRAGHHYARTGRLPRDHQREYAPAAD